MKAMGKTANRLRELHPSRHHTHEIRLADVVDLLKKYLGDRRPHVQSDEVTSLIVAIGIAASEKARRIAGNESRKKSLEGLRAMHRLADDELIAVLPTCDMVTFGRIQTAHVELYYERHGIPVLDIPEVGLSESDWIAALDGDAPACVRFYDALKAASADSECSIAPRCAIELPAVGQLLHLPLGIAGLRDAIANAIKVAEQESGSAGNKPTPHMDELAMACEVFMRRHPPTPNIPGMLDKAPPSPAVSFTANVFEMAGMMLGESRIEELLTAARKKIPK